LYGVVSSEGDLYVGVFEQVSDEVIFFSDVCESSPLGFGVCVRVVVNCFVSVGGWLGSGRVDCEGIVM
jgi:hypothetical protein